MQSIKPFKDHCSCMILQEEVSKNKVQLPSYLEPYSKNNKQNNHMTQSAQPHIHLHVLRSKVCSVVP